MTHLGTTEVVAAPHFGSDGLLNRELSWLDFNERVLSLADEPERPLLERTRFLAIFSANLDEFFQVRVAGLAEQVRLGIRTPSPDGLTPTEQLAAIRARVSVLCARQQRIFAQEIAPDLEKERIRFVEWSECDDDDRRWLSSFFQRQIFPVLTPLAVDPAHPFPYISNLSLNLAVVVSDPTEPHSRFARVKVPPSLPRFIALPDGERFMPLEELIAGRLDALFPGMDVLEHHAFRVTRNADLDVEEDEAEDLLEAIELGLRQRRLSPHVVRLEVADGLPDKVKEVLLDELDLDDSSVYACSGMLDLGGLASLYPLDRPDLKEPDWAPTTQTRLANVRRRALLPPREVGTSTVVDPSRRPVAAELDEGRSIFDVLRDGDVLVHHPYDSFASSVETFIEQAADDPAVLAIKWTLYRTSGPPSPIVRNLIRAAEAGKQVVALVELKARFDEAANILWARALEEAGVHVVYGVVGLKTHAKIALVVRQEKDHIARYTHVGSGNYNPNTATIYEDIGVLSADPDVGADVSDLFNFLTGYSRQRAFRRLCVAPYGMRDQLLDLIRREEKQADRGHIVMKVNNLVDPQVIEALYSASSAGTQVDLIVRGVCCLRPGVEGLSENIRVRSILGRYLEHSRIFRFGAAPDEADYFVGSPDVMGRNLDGRVEVIAPVTEPALRERIEEILTTNMADDVQSWELTPDGSWARRVTTDGVATHARLRELALARAHSRGIDA